ncbi:hypothetical protein [Brachybacterium sp. GPGPB12]|uniref:hypothetical protein n=1 Tax=Brachybacterium sp. GPGPB12 TaxID=3023517 RepID=UPI0031345BA3
MLDLEFTLDFAQHSPEEFVRIFLVEGLRAKCVVLGEDALFGRANAGNIDTMRELGRSTASRSSPPRTSGPRGRAPAGSPPRGSGATCSPVTCAPRTRRWAGRTPSPT